MYLSDVKAQIVDILKSKYNIDGANFDVLPTSNLNDGDFYTNVALKYAKNVGKNPIDFATEFASYLNNGSYKVEVKAPGFINFF